MEGQREICSAGAAVRPQVKLIFTTQATVHVCGGHVMLFHINSEGISKNVNNFGMVYAFFLLESSGYIFGTHTHIYIYRVI